MGGLAGGQKLLKCGIVKHDCDPEQE